MPQLRLRTRALVASCISATALSAQTTQVIPDSFANTEAAASTGWPFGLGTPCRVQYVYGAAETGFTSPVLIRSLNLRANNIATFRLDPKGVPRFTGKFLAVGAPAVMVFLP